MNADRTLLKRQLTLLTVMAIVGFSFRFLPYWKEQYDGWLMCIWGANAVLPLLLVGISQSRSLVWSYVIPLVGFVVSDLIIQWILHEKHLDTATIGGRLVIYGIFFVLAQLGLIIRWVKMPRWERVLTGVGLTLVGSIIFFLFSNWLVWLHSTPADGQYYYPPTWAGLLTSYEMGWPFFKNQFMADGLFSAAFFGVFVLAERRWQVAVPNKVSARTTV